MIDRTTDRAGGRIPDGALWTSAALLAGAIGAMAVGVNDTPAHAEMVVKDSGFTMMTTDAGDSEVLFVIDDRSEDLLIYQVRPGDRFELRHREGLADLFARARGVTVPTP